MSASKGSLGESSKTTTDRTVNSLASSTPTFNATGQSLISRLAGNFNSGESGTSRASDALFRLAQANEGGSNPYVEDIIRVSNSEGARMRDSGLAQLRAGGYRGGTAANIYNQGSFGDRFAAGLAGENARLRFDAYDRGQDRALQAYGGAGSADSTGQGLALQLLALLRGEDNKAAETSKNYERNVTKRDPEFSFAI